MTCDVTIENGFATVGAGVWLMAYHQPVVYSGVAKRLRRKGWFVRDRSILELVEIGAQAVPQKKALPSSSVAAASEDVPKAEPAVWAKCSLAKRPFLTHIPCAAEIFAVSEKVLVASAQSWKDAKNVKPVPMSARFAFCVTQFVANWVVMATKSRTTRLVLGEDEMVSVRPEAVVAWTTKMPTGFCPRLSLWDVLLPRGPRELSLTFYGPGVVWIEGASERNGRVIDRRRFGYGI